MIYKYFQLLFNFIYSLGITGVITDFIYTALDSFYSPVGIIELTFFKIFINLRIKI